MPLHPSTRSWEIVREQVDILKVIGKGAFSQVAKATVKNVRGYQEYITVAVKMLKGQFVDSLYLFECISLLLLFYWALIRNGFACEKKLRVRILVTIQVTFPGSDLETAN